MKKMTVALLFVAASLFAAEPHGRVRVHMAPGYAVFVDGAAAGQTSTDEDGKVLQLTPGPHRVMLRSPEGREASFAVTVVAGDTRDVTLSPLGFRKPAAAMTGDATSEVRVECNPSDCKVTFKPALDGVAAGRHPLVVTRGSQTLRMDVDVPESSIVTVGADFSTNTIHVTDLRRRPLRIAVAEARDALSPLAIPPHWKTAIRVALPSGSRVEDASSTNNSVRVTLRVPSDDVALSLLQSLARSQAFADVGVGSQPRRDKVGWLVDIVFFFAR
jgi:hypothetical protein